MESEQHKEYAQDYPPEAYDYECTPPTWVLRPHEEAQKPKYGTTTGQRKTKLRKGGKQVNAVKWPWFIAKNAETIFTGLIFAATTTYTIVAYYQLDVMQKTLQVVERPYIWPKSRTLNDVAVGQVPTAEILFENTGRLPALNATFNVYMELTETFIPDRPEKYPNLANVPGKAFIPAGAEHRVRASAANIRLVLSGEDLSRITDHKLYLSLYGNGRFDDGLGNHWQFKFCFYYDPKYPSEPQICPNHNGYE